MVDGCRVGRVGTGQARLLAPLAVQAWGNLARQYAGRWGLLAGAGAVALVVTLRIEVVERDARSAAAAPASAAYKIPFSLLDTTPPASARRAELMSVIVCSESGFRT